MCDVLIRGLERELSAVLHKVVRAQFPDVVAQIDGKADAGQNRHLKQAQALENRRESAHRTHKTQRHPQGTVAFPEGRALMRRSGDGHGQHPEEQGGNDGQGNQVEGAEKL